jgi:SAM-dependent methyltransferase
MFPPFSKDLFLENMGLKIRKIIGTAKGKFKRTLNKQQFVPTFSGLFVNPFYFAREGLYKNIRYLSKHIAGKILDVGCGQKPYEEMFEATDYVGLEIDTPGNRKDKKADFFYEGYRFPFENGEFDSAVTFQVFEHVFNPGDFLKEIHRVLKKDGMLLITAPFVWDEHEQPNDFARYSSFGLKYLLEKHGFKIVESRKSSADVGTIFQMINAYFYKITITQNNYVNLLSAVFLMAPFNILGKLLSGILPKNKDLYLDNIILAQKETEI